MSKINPLVESVNLKKFTFCYPEITKREMLMTSLNDDKERVYLFIFDIILCFYESGYR